MDRDKRTLADIENSIHPLDNGKYFLKNNYSDENQLDLLAYFLNNLILLVGQKKSSRKKEIN